MIFHPSWNADPNWQTYSSDGLKHVEAIWHSFAVGLVRDRNGIDVLGNPVNVHLSETLEACQSDSWMFEGTQTNIMDDS